MMQDKNPFDQFDQSGAPGGVDVIYQGAPKRDNPPAGYRWTADGGLEPVPGGPAAGRPGGDRKAEADLRKEFNARTEAKNFNGIRNSYFRIRDLSKADSAQNDIALIFQYMKMLDPTSVVREGEFATAQNAAGVPDQIRNQYNKVMSGERLNPDQREKMADTAKTLYQRDLQTYNDLASEYRTYAQDYEIEPDRVAKLALDEASPPAVRADGKRDTSAPLPAVSDQAVQVSPTGEMRFSTDEDKAFAAKVQALFDKGASADAIRAFARSNGFPDNYGPDLDRAIEYRDQGGKGARIAPAESGYRPPSTVGALASSPVGSFFGSAANALTAGTMDEIVGATGGDAGQAQFAKDLMRERNPLASFGGEVAGGALALTGLGRVPGLAGRALLTDTLGGAAYGAGENNENRAAGAIMGGGAAALGSWGGSKLLSKLTGRSAAPVAPPAPSQAAQRVAGAERFGIDLPLGATSRMAGGLEKGLDILPGSAGVMQAGRNRLGEQVLQATDNVAQNFGPTTSFEGVGEAAQRGAKNWIDRFEDVSGKAYEAIPISPKAPANLSNTQATLTALTSKFQSNPKLADAMRNSRLDRYMDALGDKASALSWEDLKAFRTRIGEEIGDARFSDGTLKSELRALYGSLSEDMKASAVAQGPRALRAFERANDLYRKGQERIDTALISILGDNARKSPGAAAKALQNIATSGKASSDIKKLAQIRSSMPKEEWGEVANGLVRLLGQPANSEGRDFSAQTFIRNYDDMDDAAKNLLFGDRGRKPLREALDDFSGVVRDLADSDALRNTSNTANAVNATALISAGPAALLNPLFAAGIAGQTAGSYGLAKAWTNPAFVRWATGYAKMVRGAQKAGGKPNVGRQLELLQKVAVANPTIAAEAGGLREAITAANDNYAPLAASGGEQQEATDRP